MVKQMVHDANAKIQSKKWGTVDDIYPKSILETKSSHKKQAQK